MRLNCSPRLRVFNRILGVWGTVIMELSPEILLVRRDAPLDYQTTWRRENTTTLSQAPTAAALTAPHSEPTTVRQEKRWPSYDDLLAWFLAHKQATTPTEILLAMNEFRNQAAPAVHKLLYETSEEFCLEFAQP